MIKFQGLYCAEGAIAERVWISRETVNRILKRDRETVNVNPGKYIGLPRASTDRDGRTLVRIVHQDRFISCNALNAEWAHMSDVYVSRRTVNGQLIHMGYRARKSVVKLKLTQRHKGECLA